MDQVAQTLDQSGKFPWQEDVLISSLGIPRRELGQLRKKTIQGADWRRIDLAVWWSEDAIRHLLPPLDPAGGSPQVLPEAPEEKSAQVLRVTAWNFPNPRVIHAVAENNGHHGTITVRVKDARLFRPGMKILARPAEIGAAWEFMGNPEKPEVGARHPRWPGRW
jgi:hypothetical protein